MPDFGAPITRKSGQPGSAEASEPGCRYIGALPTLVSLGAADWQLLYWLGLEILRLIQAAGPAVTLEMLGFSCVGVAETRCEMRAATRLAPRPSTAASPAREKA